MKIGIVSDSHGKTSRLRTALQLLADAGAETIVHCGDICSTECLKLLGRCGMEAYLVAGNMDLSVVHMTTKAEKAGVHFSPTALEVPLPGGEHLVATHGNCEELLDDLIAGQQFPYVCCGHTHRQRDERVGRVRVINPGALNHPKGPSYPTAALLDTNTDELTFIRIDS